MTIPKTMLAAVLVELRQPLVIDEVALPDTLGVGQVLVKIEYSGICGSQLSEIDGAKGEDKYLPHLLGHVGSGHVMAVGPGVRHVKDGDAVVLHWRKAPGIEADPPAYRWRGKPLNSYQTVVELIASTTTTKGLAVRCELDTRSYLKGIKVTDAEMAMLNIAGDPVHPEWNYTISPRSVESTR